VIGERGDRRLGRAFVCGGAGQERHVILRAPRKRLENAFLQQMAVDDRPRGRALDASGVVGIVELNRLIVRRTRELNFPRRLCA
jgi:hypothetical protein